MVSLYTLVNTFYAIYRCLYLGSMVSFTYMLLILYSVIVHHCFHVAVWLHLLWFGWECDPNWNEFAWWWNKILGSLERKKILNKLILHYGNNCLRCVGFHALTGDLMESYTYCQNSYYFNVFSLENHLKIFSFTCFFVLLESWQIPGTFGSDLVFIHQFAVL